MRKNGHLYFVLNAMGTTAYPNQFMRDLYKKHTILFLYGSACYIVHNSHMLSNGDV